MDRKGILILIVTIGAYLGYYFGVEAPKQRKFAEDLRKYNEEFAKWKAAQDAAKPAVPLDPTKPPIPVASASPGSQAPAASPTEPEQRETMMNSSGSVEYSFSSHGGGIVKATLREHFEDKARGTRVVLNEFGSIPIGGLSQEPGAELFIKQPWKMTADKAKGTVTFERTDAASKIKTTKVFTLPGDKTLAGEYAIKLDITYENTGGEPMMVPANFLHIGSSAPLRYSEQAAIYQGFDWWADGSTNFTGIGYFQGGGIIFKDPPKDVYRSEKSEIRWGAVTNQYFTTLATILTAPDATAATRAATLGQTAWARSTTISPDVWRAANHALEGDVKLHRIDGAIGMPAIPLTAGQKETRNIQIFAGPRELRRLTHYTNNESDVLNYGSFLGIPTGPISRSLLHSMNWLFSKVGSYALAIVLLTITVKAFLWPLQSKANKNMKKMADLGPEMKKLQEKFKEDPIKMQQETGKLFKKAGVNPLGGCWPILIQIPIFIGFYNMLDKAVELRHHGFWWVSDLSAPDTLFHLWFLPVNPLPLVMAGTMYLSMHLTPSTADPIQKRMFMLMPLIFIVMCYNFASALALYWTVQNIISIVQILINKRNKPVPGAVELIPPSK